MTLIVGFMFRPHEIVLVTVVALQLCRLKKISGQWGLVTTMNGGSFHDCFIRPGLLIARLERNRRNILVVGQGRDPGSDGGRHQGWGDWACFNCLPVLAAFYSRCGCPVWGWDLTGTSF